jgi:hypothetical protein
VTTQDEPRWHRSHLTSLPADHHSDTNTKRDRDDEHGGHEHGLSANADGRWLTIAVVTGFDRADAIASLVVVALIAKAGLILLRDSGRILLEAAPAGLDPNAIGDALVRLAGVAEVHDLHVWTITSGQPALSAHVLVAPRADCHRFRIELQHLLRLQFGVTHTTLQVDHVGDEPGAVGPDGYAAHCDEAHGPAFTSTDPTRQPAAARSAAR